MSVDRPALPPVTRSGPAQRDRPALFGLVLAGGDSRRMGRNKAEIRYHRGEPQVRHAFALLAAVTAKTYVSVRSAQAGDAVYASLPLIEDSGAMRGPAAGLLAAWALHPAAAWLVLAADLPFATHAILADLAAGRDPAKVATAFRHPDGTLEPLCTIWEPAAREILLERVAAGDGSLRRVLESGPSAVLEPRDPGSLASIDTASEHDAARAAIEASERPLEPETEA